MKPTWLGYPQKFNKDQIAMDIQISDYTAEFIDSFNKNPTNAMQNISRALHDNPYDIGPYLFQCQELSPNMLQQYIFSTPEMADSLLFYFYSTLNMEFMPLHKALSLALPRIALSREPKQLESIFEQFASAYLLMNPYLNFTIHDIAKIAASSIIFSLYKIQNSLIPKDQYVVYLKEVNMSYQLKNELYNKLNDNPVPLYFTFASSQYPPNLYCEGFLKKKGGILKRSNSNWYVVGNFTLKCFKDQSSNSPEEEIDLSDTITKFVEATGKEQAHLQLMKATSDQFIYKYEKGKKKPSSKNIYLLYGNEGDLATWGSVLNYVSFSKGIIQYIERKCGK